MPARGAVGNPLEVQPDDMIGRHRDGEHNPLEGPQASEGEDEVVADGTCTWIRGEIDFSSRGREGPRNTTSHRSPFRATN